MYSYHHYPASFAHARPSTWSNNAFPTKSVPSWAAAPILVSYAHGPPFASTVPDSIPNSPGPYAYSYHVALYQ